jgi:hypothetical protein
MGFIAYGGQVSAQRPGVGGSDAGSYVSELTDLEVTFTEDWELDDSEVSQDEPELENLTLVSDAGLLMIGFVAADDPEGYLAEMIDNLEQDAESFDVVDEDASRGFAWAVAEAEFSDGSTVTAYLDVDDSYTDGYLVATMLVADPGDFLDQYELVNDSVEIDGEQILGEFSVDEIDEILGGATSTTQDAEATPDDTNVTETGDGGRDGQGSSGSDSYVFEIVDLEVAVSGDVEINSVDTDDAYEQVLLVGSGSIGVVTVFESPLEAEATLDAFMSGFLGELDSGEQIDSDVDGSVAWAVYEAEINGDPTYIYITVDDARIDGFSFIQLIAAPVDMFEDEFVAFQDSVEIDGDPMFADVDVDDLLLIIEG